MRVFAALTTVVIACSHGAPPPTPPAQPSSVLAPAPVAAATALRGAPAAAKGPPAARTVDVHETLFGVTVSDPYRWMEGNDNAELAAWLAAQGSYARDYLDRIAGRAALLARVGELGNATGAVGGLALAGGRLFYEYTAPGEQLAKLMVRDHGKDRVLVDPAKLGDRDHHASLNSFAPSADGALLAYNVALGGGEIGTIRVIDMATGKLLPDAIDRVWGESSAFWMPDGKSFAYKQLAPAAAGVDPMLNQQVRLHVLGQPVERDTPLLGGGVDATIPIAPVEWPFVWSVPHSTWVLATVGGAHSERRYAVAPRASLGGKTAWKTIAEYADGVTHLVVHGDRAYLTTYKNASNSKIVSVPLAKPDLANARVDIPEDKQATIVDAADARDALYFAKQVDGLSHLYRWPYQGTPTEIALPFAGSLAGIVTDPLADGATVYEEGWTHPGAYYAYDVQRHALVPTGLAVTTNADYSAIAADEAVATSADGTSVPVSILHRKDLAADGKAPAIVGGYAGYGVSITPVFSPTLLAWLERGGVLAVCHGRGGGEKGHQWQLDGTHEHKMTGVHDFEACGQYLVDHEISSSAHLFAQGGSMGGILIGRAITDRPELFVAANIQVGIVDPVRILAAENGANQLSELGDPATEVGWKGLYDMDPYLHVVAAPYPATLFTVGLNDKRVAPWMSAKMAARMQTATTAGRPVMVRVEGDAGHGVGSTRDQAFLERADVWAFFLAASGDPAFAVAPAASR